MPPSECTRQIEMLELVRSPVQLAPDTHPHLVECSECRELVAVARAIESDFEQAMPSVRVPPSGVIWWRTQRRERERKTRSAARMEIAVQALSIAAGSAVAVSAFRTAASWLNLSDRLGFRNWMARNAELFDFASLTALASSITLPLAIGIGACLAAAPVAIYFALREE